MSEKASLTQSPPLADDSTDAKLLGSLEAAVSDISDAQKNLIAIIQKLSDDLARDREKSRGVTATEIGAKVSAAPSSAPILGKDKPCRSDLSGSESLSSRGEPDRRVKSASRGDSGAIGESGLPELKGAFNDPFPDHAEGLARERSSQLLTLLFQLKLLFLSVSATIALIESKTREIRERLLRHAQQQRGLKALLITWRELAQLRILPQVS